MSRILKRNLLIVLSVLLSFSLAIFALGQRNLSTVNASATVPTQYTTATASEFYMVEGAQINVDATGIRFTAKVTKSYYNTLTNNGENAVTFYAVVNGKGADESKAQMKEFASQPTFDQNAVDTDTYSMELVVKYDNYVPTVGTYDKAYMTQIVASAYAQKADGTWIKAFSPDNNARSMRIVANAAYVAELENEEAGEDENAEYKSKLANYFKEDLTTRTTEEMAYVLLGGAGKMVLPALTNDSYVGAYIGTKNVASEITENEITLANVDLTQKQAGDLQYITALTKNGGLYTMKVAYATDVLTASNIGTTLLGGANGYYVLGEDINMGTSATDGVNTSATWGSTTSILAGDFSGTLNGLGHTLKSLTTSSAASGLFKTITDSRIINLNVTGKVRAASGLLAYSAVGECEIDNVYANINRNGQNAVGLIREGNSGAVINVSNTVVEYTDTSTNKDLGYFVARNKGTVNLTNAYGIAGANLAVGTANSSGKTNGTFSAYDDIENLIVDYANKIASNQVGRIDCISSLYTEVNESNYTVLSGATEGLYVLTSDITLPSDWSNSGTFSGILNGSGKTIKVETKSGIFYDFTGTVKNVSITMPNGTNSQRGALGYRAKTGATVKDTFIKVSSNIGDNGGAIIGVVLNDLTIDNVVVNATMSYNASRGIIAGFGNNSKTAEVTATNLYIISKVGLMGNLSSYARPLTINGTLIDSDDDKNLTGEITSITGINVYKTVDDFKTFYGTGYTNLTEFLQSQCESVLGCAKESASSN